MIPRIDVISETTLEKTLIKKDIPERNLMLNYQSLDYDFNRSKV